MRLCVCFLRFEKSFVFYLPSVQRNSEFREVRAVMSFSFDLLTGGCVLTLHGDPMICEWLSIRNVPARQA